jgi:hypothetical protein
MKQIAILVLILALPGWIADAAANPWVYESGKESGKSRHHRNHARHGGFELRSGPNVDRDRASILRGRLPPHGKCRAWFLSRLPGC